jgi:hypothetical protein
MKIISNRVLALTLFLFLAGFSHRADAGSINFDINSDVEMDLRYDWVINVKVNNSNYLSYPGSTLKPLTKLKISYRLNPRFIADIPTAGQYTDYEELWYHSTQIVGCRRLHDLTIPTGYQGAIRIVPSAAVSTSDGAIAGAIVRLLLDVVLQNCKLSTSYVPASVFSLVVDDLSHFHFGTNQSISFGEPISIQLYSNPLSLSQTLFYN